MNPTDDNSQSKEKLILLAAEEEFFLKGYDGASTAVIAKAAGVTHAMVNYYYRSKENLFIKILDYHIHELLSSLKPLMNMESEPLTVMTDVALAIFDRMDEDRKFPFIIQDIARTHPEFLLRYREVFTSTCLNSIKKHKGRLDQFAAEGKITYCSMHELGDTIITLATAPFLNIPLLANVAKLPEEQINSYIKERREEMKKIILVRYGSNCHGSQTKPCV